MSPTRASDQLVMTSDHRHGSLACVVDGHAAPSAFAMEIRLVPREEGTHVQTSMRGSYVLGRRRFSCAHGSPGIHEEYLECDTNGVEQAAFLTSLRRCLGDVGDPVRFRPPRVPP